MIKLKFIYTITSILLMQFCFSQNKVAELIGIENDINLLLKRYQAVGLSVAVIKENEVIYSNGFGYRDLEKKLPATINTVYPIGSITKAFTGTLLGVLESKTQISLKDKPAVYIPNFQFFNDKMNNLIIIEDLLSHNSGIGNQGTSERFFPNENMLKVVQRLKYLRPEAEIKNSFEYSNMGYTLAGTIVEQVTKKSWETNISEMILEPIEMTNTYTIRQDMEKSNNYSLPYGLYNGITEKVNFEEFQSVRPAGAMKSSVIDLSNWIKTWLNNGVYNGKQVIPQEYVNKATTLQNIKNDLYEKDAFLYGEGFGWRLRSSYGKYRLDHGGNTYGFSSNLVLFPFEGIGIVVLTNQDNSLLPYMIADNITRRLFNIDLEPEYPVVVKEIYKPSSYTPLKKDKLPSHPLNFYCGSYDAKGYGTIEIVEEKNKLYAILPTYKFILEHSNYNTFFLKATQEFKDVFNPQFDIQFINNTDGKIAQLKMHSQKAPVVFNKN